MARVLIVDDSQTETFWLVACLARHGHEAITAANGDDGVVVAQRQQPNIILMDVVMPGLNGFQATRQLTQHDSTRHIPVIIVTSKRQQTDEVWGRRQGASGYLIKPLRERELLDEINRVLCMAAPT